jgi:hypothetical protein
VLQITCPTEVWYETVCSGRNLHRFRFLFPLAAVILFFGCGYRFGTVSGDSPFPTDIKTIMLESAVNNTTVTGIETEITNDLRREFAMGEGLKPVRSGADVVLKTLISSYTDVPSTYRADGKELTRLGTLSVACSLCRADSTKVTWRKDLAASYSYNVTDTISGTLSNRRKAISKMINQLIPRIHRSLYDNF